MFSQRRLLHPLHSTHPSLANRGDRSERTVLPLWRSLHSLNLMLPKEDRRAMLLRLYNEDTPLTDHSKDRFFRATDEPAAGVVKDEDGDVEREMRDDAVKTEEVEEKDG